MTVNKEEVKYIAKLSKLKFSDDEAESFAKEFKNILSQFKDINNLELDDIKINKSEESVLRKDEIKKYDTYNLYNNVKGMRETSIEVPKIIE